MSNIVISKVNTLPATIDPNIVYLVKNNDSFDIYATDELGSQVFKGFNSKADFTNIMNLLDAKANITDLANVASGGTVTLTAAAVGLGNVDNTHDTDKPVSTATQTALDLKANLTDLNQNTVGLGNVDNTADLNKPLSNDAIAALALKANAADISNVNNTSDLNKPISTATQAALDLKTNGTDFISLKNSISTALNSQNTLIGAKASELELTTHVNNTNNPHNVTKAQLGLGNVSNTADTDKPLSTAAINALALKADKTYVDGKIATITSGTLTFDKNSVGLGNVDNTSDVNKPISTATQTALDLKVNVADMASYVASGTITFDKASLGLGNVDNTADLTKPLSIAAQAALAGKADAGAFQTFQNTMATSLSAKLNIADLVTVGKAGMGLDQVDNTSDINKPVSTATQNALALKANTLDVATELSYKLNISDLPAITKSSLGLGNVDNTSDLSKPLSTATTFALASKTDVTTFNTSISALNAALSAKLNIADLTAQSKTALGLDQVDNTRDLDKPISTAVTNALTLKADKTYVDSLNTNVVSSITPTTLGLGNVNNTADANKPVSAATLTALSLKADIAYVDTKIAGVVSGNPNITFNKNSVGLGNVDNTADINKPVSIATAAALALKANLADVQNLSNSILSSVTATSLGLGSVDNTSDINKPVSTAQAAAIALRAPLSAVSDLLTYVNNNLALKLNIADMATQSKTQLGLDQVNNTSDANKPVSTATAAALALKADQTYVDTNLGLKLNIADLGTVGKTQLGLDQVNNTSDANKPISTATQTALDLKANETEIGTLNTALTNGLSGKVDTSTYNAFVTATNTALSLLSATSITTIIPNQW